MSKTITAPSAKAPHQDVFSSSEFDFDFDLEQGGTYEVTSQPLPYGFLFSPKGKGLPLIVLSPHGADRTAEGSRGFLRADWLRKLPYNTLVWQDPTAALGDMVQSGFGLGTAEHWTLPNIAHVVANLRDQLGIANENIVFVGFGGGGFTSLVLVSHFPGASCFVNNPNTDLLKERRGALSKVLGLGYPDLSLVDLARTFPERFIAIEALKANPTPPRLYCLQNARQDVRQFRAFMTGMIGIKAKAPPSTEDHGGDGLIVDYYVDDQTSNKAVKPELWAHHLERIADWFATPQMRAASRLTSPRTAPLAIEQSPVRGSWHALLPTEVAYWETVISGRHGKPETVKKFRERAAGHYPVPPSVVTLLQRLDIVRARLLDVGAGPHTTIGPVLYGTRLNIVAVDPLAEPYNELLDKYGIEPAIRTVKGEAETLSQQFTDERFDLVYCRNALDHMRAPWTALQQMLDVCTPGGMVHIEGSVNEGLKQGYGGLHQWNVMPAERDLIIWNDEGAKLASRTLTGVAQIRTAGKDAWFSATLIKEL
ncbi:class I SAM-dependent methyltransferase [Ancylobacter sp. Lp-2]|nr:class I SAM-dependent methyltransferase [Ancylobacter sp. Lp-2]